VSTTDAEKAGIVMKLLVWTSKRSRPRVRTGCVGEDLTKVPRLVASIEVEVKDMVMVMVARKAAEVRTGARDCASEQAWFQVEREDTTTPNESGDGEKLRREA
jgi:hypothetical protein